MTAVDADETPTITVVQNWVRPFEDKEHVTILANKILLQLGKGGMAIISFDPKSTCNYIVITLIGTPIIKEKGSL